MHNFIIRGFDDQIHKKLGEMANQRGVSINSIVKDAVDGWLKEQQLEVPRKHHLVIYSDGESMIRMLKSMDRLAKEGNLFRCFCGPPNSHSTELLSKLKWFDGTLHPYIYSNDGQQMQREQPQNQILHKTQKDVMRYCAKVIENLAKNADNKQVCCMDLLINDVGKSSLKQALAIEKVYDNDRMAGLMYCAYRTDNLLNSEIKDLIELFELHDQVFILKEDEVYKLHITKENIHKLFLS
jgi:hypothetical protein